MPAPRLVHLKVNEVISLAFYSRERWRDFQGKETAIRSLRTSKAFANSKDDCWAEASFAAECQHRFESIRRRIVGIVSLRIGASDINFKDDPKADFERLCFAWYFSKDEVRLTLPCSGTSPKIDLGFGTGL